MLITCSERLDVIQEIVHALLPIIKKKIRAHKVNKKKRKEKTVLVWTFINFQKFKLQNMH